MNVNDKVSLKDKNILITGGLGFIGSNLAHRLVKEGANVVIFDACLEPYGWGYHNLIGIEDDVTVVKGDIRDQELLTQHVKGKDIVYHLAAQVGREISMENPELDIEINCNGTLNVCRACAESGSDIKIIYAGTRGEIGEPVYMPVDHDHPTNPTDVYGANKLAAEKYLYVYSRVHGYPVTTLRLNNVYGPRCQMHHGFYGVLNWFMRNAMKDEAITVYGDGSQTRDYVYVDDVVDAFIRAAQYHSTDGKHYMIGSGVETPFIEMVDTILYTVGRGDKVHIPFPPERESIDIRRFVIDHSRFSKDTGWAPTADLKTGIEQTFEFYKTNLELYLK